MKSINLGGFCFSNLYAFVSLDFFIGVLDALIEVHNFNLDIAQFEVVNSNHFIIKDAYFVIDVIYFGKLDLSIIKKYLDHGDYNVIS